LEGNTGRGKDESSCSIDLLAYGLKSDGTVGSITVNASYTSSNTTTWANDTTGTADTVATSKGSNMVVTNKSKLVSSTSSNATFGSGSFDMYFSNCNYTSARAYMVVAYGSSSSLDPVTATSNYAVVDLGAVSTSTKALVWNVSIPADHVTGVFKAKWMCVAGTTTSRSTSSDSNIKFVSSVFTGTVSGTSGGTFSAFSRAAATDGTTPAADAPSGATFTLENDPDELNSDDQMGIVKVAADEIKRRTDALLSASSTVSRIGYALVDNGLDRATTEAWTGKVAGGATATDLAAALMAAPGRAAFTGAADADFAASLYRRALGRDATAGELDSALASVRSGGTNRARLVAELAGSAEGVARWADRSYVVAAFQVATPRMPTADELERFTGSLRSGNSKVNMTEDVALLGASSDDWNVAAPDGRTPAAATFKAPSTSPAPAPVVVRPPVVVPAPAATAPAAPKASAKRRATLRKSRKASVRKATVRKAPARKATVRKATVRKAPARKVVAKRTATVRKVRR